MIVGAGSRLRLLLAAIAGVVLVLAAVAAIVVWDPVGDLVRVVDLPDVPRWLLWALGKVKFVVIAAVLLAVAVRELRRRRGA
jgi:bacteriorhodopsin